MNKNILLKTLLILIFLIFSKKSYCQKTEISFVQNLVVSDVSLPNRYKVSGIQNLSKRSWGMGFQIEQKICKLFSAEVSIKYSERKALEFFALPFGDESQQVSGVTNEWLFNIHPTSPQSPSFNPNNPLFPEFPNFKYAHLGLTPMFQLSKNRFRYSIGVGLFAGMLLNRDEVTFDENDFPFYELFFEPPINIYGEVRYHRWDFGWNPKLEVDYQIAEKWKIGLSVSSLNSLVRLNDTFIVTDHTRLFNTLWRVQEVGLQFTYTLDKA